MNYRKKYQNELIQYFDKKNIFHNKNIIKSIMSKVGRNAPCPCGSGKKYKKCCLSKDEAAQLEKAQEMAQKMVRPSARY